MYIKKMDKHVSDVKNHDDNFPFKPHHFPPYKGKLNYWESFITKEWIGSSYFKYGYNKDDVKLLNSVLKDKLTEHQEIREKQYNLLVSCKQHLKSSKTDDENNPIYFRVLNEYFRLEQEHEKWYDENYGLLCTTYLILTEDTPFAFGYNFFYHIDGYESNIPEEVQEAYNIYKKNGISNIKNLESAERLRFLDLMSEELVTLDPLAFFALKENKDPKIVNNFIDKFLKYKYYTNSIIKIRNYPEIPKSIKNIVNKSELIKFYGKIKKDSWLNW